MAGPFLLVLVQCLLLSSAAPVAWAKILARSSTCRVKHRPKTVDVGGPLGWTVGAKKPFKLPTIYARDKLRFSWAVKNSSGAHTVWSLNKFRFNTCNFTAGKGAKLVASKNFTSKPLRYAGWYYFADGVGQNCKLGLKVAVRVRRAPRYDSVPCRPPPPVPKSPPPAKASPPPPKATSPPPKSAPPPPKSSPPPPRKRPPPPKEGLPPPKLPAGSPPPPKKSPPPPPASVTTINVGTSPGFWTFGVKSSWTQPSVKKGDKLVFTWAGFSHDVMKFASSAKFDKCDFTGSTTIAGIKASGSVSYNVTEAAGTVIYFGCSVSAHCGAGMKVAVTVT